MALRHQLAAYSPIRAGSIIAALQPVVRSGAIDRLRATLLDDYQARDAVLVDSGTHALQLALEIAIRARGGNAVVALPGFTCFDVATAAVGAGARVLLYDVDPTTLSPDFDSLRRVVREGATVAVIASLYGVPIPWDQVTAAAPGVLIIEDAAQGHGAKWAGRPLGSLGDLSVLSFSRGKGWTGGYGGALLIRDSVASGAVHPRGIDLKGIIALAAQWMLGRPALYGIPRRLPGLNLGETVYHPPTSIQGISESAASALLYNRDAATKEVSVRKRNADRIGRTISRVGGLKPIALSASSDPGHLRLPFRVSLSVAESGDLRRAAHLGIAPSYPVALKDLPELRGSVVRFSETPGASELASTLATAPTHSRLSETDFQAIETLLLGLATRRG